jgi:hypothetical protein
MANDVGLSYRFVPAWNMAALCAFVHRRGGLWQRKLEYSSHSNSKSESCVIRNDRSR